MLDPSKVGWIAAILGGLAIAVTGCQTEAYCFVDCSGETTATTTGTGGAAGDECVFNCGGTGGTGGGTGTTSVTGSEASRMVCAVEPVDTLSTPAATSAEYSPSE